MKCKHFDIRELVAPEIYDVRGDAAWELLNTKLLITLDTFHEVFGPITINDWHTGGRFKESGLRSFNTPTGAKYSMHKFGCAADPKPQRTTPREMYDYILANPSKFPFLTTLEDIEFCRTPGSTEPGWVHADVRNNHQDGVRIVKP